MALNIGSAQNLSTRDIIVRQLEDFENLSKDVFDNLAHLFSQKTHNPASTEKIEKLVDQLIKKDIDMQKCLMTAKQQLENQLTVNQLQKSIGEKDHEILKLQSQLREAEQILSTSLFQAKKKVESLSQATSNTINSEDLVRFAFRISTGNSVESPENWQVGDPRRPYPLDIEMRAGRLGQINLNTTQIPQIGLTDATNDLPALSSSIGNEETNSSVIDEVAHQSNEYSSENMQWDSSLTSGDDLRSIPNAVYANGMESSRSRHDHATTNGDVGYMSSSSDTSSSGESA